DETLAAAPAVQDVRGSCPAALVQLAGPDDRFLPGRQAGDVEGGVEAERGKRRCDKGADGRQGGGPHGQSQPGQHVGEGEGVRHQLLPEGVEVGTGGGEGAVGSAGQQDAGLLEQLADGGGTAGVVLSGEQGGVGGGDLAAGEGEEAAEGPQALRTAD